MPTMDHPTRPDAGRDVLTGHGSAVEVRYLEGDEVTLRMLTPTDEVDTDTEADLLAQAVSHVRSRRTRVVRTALDTSTPTAVAVLDALRSRVGADIDEIALRRAGSSVMVTLRLLPVQPARRPARPVPGREARSSAPRTSRPAARRAPQPQERSR
jgi:hypothetical protein